MSSSLTGSFSSHQGGCVLTLTCVTLSYGRVETLSGFANGVFLILISIFIIFEAVQRM